MSFKLKFKFKIHNKTTNHLKNIKLSDDEGILHYKQLDWLNDNENLYLEDVYMHLYKPENIYLNFIDKNNNVQKLLLFKDIKKILKSKYTITIENDIHQTYKIQIA